GLTQYGRLVIRAGLARHSRHDQPAGVGLLADRHPRVSTTVCRRPHDRPGPGGIVRAAAGVYQSHRSDQWRWYEEVLTYCNAALPHALLMCGQSMPNKAMTEAGLESLMWLADLQRAEEAGGHLVPCGSNGFYRPGGTCAWFDHH